jgi:ACS family allantoate permease-like MFS transporter
MSLIYITTIGLINFRWRNKRLYCMMVSVCPPLAGFLGMSLLPSNPQHKWTKWGCYVLTTPFSIAIFLAWSLIPSNITGRTKRVVTSSWVFIGYCVGNICGSQIFKTSEAPTYRSGTIGCAVCFGIEFFVILTWRMLLVRRNKKRARLMEADGISEDERKKRGEALGKQDSTDFENPYVSIL